MRNESCSPPHNGTLPTGRTLFRNPNDPGFRAGKRYEAREQIDGVDRYSAAATTSVHVGIRLLHRGVPGFRRAEPIYEANPPHVRSIVRYVRGKARLPQTVSRVSTQSS